MWICISSFFLQNREQTKRFLYELHMHNHVNRFMVILSLGGHLTAWLFMSQVNTSDSIRPEKLRFRVLMEEPALERRETRLYLKLRRGDKESCRGSWLCGESRAVDRAAWMMMQPSKTAGHGWGDIGRAEEVWHRCADECMGPAKAGYISSVLFFPFSGLLDLEILDSAPGQGSPCPRTRTMLSGPSGMWKWNHPG